MKENEKKLNLWQYFVARTKSDIPLLVLMALYAAFCIGSVVYFAVLGDHLRDCGISAAYLLVVPIFYIAEKNLHIRSPFAYTAFMLLFCAFCLLGASYNFYTIIPFLDDILHACWGVVFATLGFCIAKSLTGEPKTTKAFVSFLLFGVGFCMIMAIVWELYEFSCDNIFADYDMQEDTIVDHIHSFMLHDPYDHLHTLQIDGIAYTQIFDADGNLLYTVEGGYLDIGLIDTMNDIIWCAVSSVALCLVLALDRKFGGRLEPHIIPVYVGNEGVAAQTAECGVSAEGEEPFAPDNSSDGAPEGGTPAENDGATNAEAESGDAENKNADLPPQA